MILDQNLTRFCVLAVAMLSFHVRAHAQSASTIAADEVETDAVLSVDQVAKHLNDADWVFVDTRASGAYNGWALGDISRGGHISGAVDFPASWLDVEHEGKSERLAAALRAKRIEPQKHIVLYSITESDRREVGDFLKLAGFKRIHFFDLRDWIADPNRPLNRYPKYQLLVPAEIVKRLVDGEATETFANAKRIQFVEVSWGAANVSYDSGHVPGSFHVNTDHFEPPPKWRLGSPQTLTKFAAMYGFQSDDTVIVSGADPTASYRLAIVLRYMGVADVRVLNGGFAAWRAAGYAVDTESHNPSIAESFGAEIPQRPELIESVEQVKERLHQPDLFTLVDNRTRDEFIGKSSGYTYHKHKGRMPGSVYGQADFAGKNSLTPYRNIDDTMRNADEIRALWKRSGIDTDKHLSFMCGGGWRAAEVLTFAQVIGVKQASLYSDGWIGWSNDRTNPVDTGPVNK